MSFRINTNVQSMTALRSLQVTGAQMSQSMTRLSTGLRINSGADDPAGLIGSENFRAQITGMDAAIRNNQDAINYAKTAEGGLSEVSKLLNDARSLAVSSSNNATLTSEQRQANQSQLDSILNSITRISQNTSFGDRKLLNGTAGVQAATADSGRYTSFNFTGNFSGTTISTNSAITVDVTTVAEQAIVTGTQSYNSGDLVGAGSFSLNGRTFNSSSSTTVEELVSQVNAAQNETGVSASFTSGSGIVFTSNSYGQRSRIDLTATVTGLVQAGVGNTSDNGVDAVATVTVNDGTNNVSATFTGGVAGRDAFSLVDSDGNVFKLTASGNATGAYENAGQLVVGSSSFQIGANKGETATLAIGNFSSSNLGLSGLDLTSQSNAQTALGAIDTAISQVSKGRGEIGSFTRNNLESNVRALSIAKENLSASESAIRDVDVADEMTTYTKLQILQQSGMAMLAQANSQTQSVLSLLR